MLSGPIRLGQLRRLIPRASKKVLVQQLRELENDGVIARTDLSGKIKHVEYTISAPLGMAVANLVGFLSDWGNPARTGNAVGKQNVSRHKATIRRGDWTNNHCPEGCSALCGFLCDGIA
jgi:DNA-binding HxlR family transcriptional regulator